jgi:hypothetical protein
VDATPTIPDDASDFRTRLAEALIRLGGTRRSVGGMVADRLIESGVVADPAEVERLRDALTEAEFDRDKNRADHDKACVHFAELYEAATGNTEGGPNKGIIEDAREVRERGERAEAAVAAAHAAVVIADAEDVTDWQRGYRACADRVRAALATDTDPQEDA